MENYTIDDSRIRRNISSFYQMVEMPGGWMFNHVRTLRLIDLYFNGKFEKGQYDSRNQRKYFYNVVKPACDIATKFIDLDTKDLILISENSEEWLTVWLMERELKQWLKDNKFGKLLNQIGVDYPKYGHVVIKKDKTGKWNKVGIPNLRSDTSVSWLKNSPFVYEIHRMTLNEMRKMDGWDTKVMDELAKATDHIFDVYECYDYNPDGGWAMSIRTELFNKQQTLGATGFRRNTEAYLNLGQDSYLPSRILFEGNVDDLPYRELKWEDVEGRWLGMGFVEYLFDNQVRMNEVVHLKAQNLRITSKRFFQTQDDAVGNNALTDIETGDIVKTAKEIVPVASEERNMPAFNDEEARWDLNNERKTFSFDISRGENLPSTTPLGVAQLSAGMVASFYELRRENFGMFIKDLLLDDVIPDFKKDKAKKHLLAIANSESEIDLLDRALAEARVNEFAWNVAQKTGYFPSKQERDAEQANIEQQLQKGKLRTLDIPDAFYDDAKYRLDLLITGEQISPVKEQSLQFGFTALSQNPAILQNKGTRAMFFKFLEMGGLSPAELNLLEDKFNTNSPDQPVDTNGQPQQLPVGSPMPSSNAFSASSRQGRAMQIIQGNTTPML